MKIKTEKLQMIPLAKEKTKKSNLGSVSDNHQCIFYSFQSGWKCTQYWSKESSREQNGFKSRHETRGWK